MDDLRTALELIKALWELRQERCSPMNEYNTGYYHALELVIQDLNEVVAQYAGNAKPLAVEKKQRHRGNV